MKKIIILFIIAGICMSINEYNKKSIDIIDMALANAEVMASSEGLGANKGPVVERWCGVNSNGLGTMCGETIKICIGLDEEPCVGQRCKIHN